MCLLLIIRLFILKMMVLGRNGSVVMVVMGC